MSMNQAPQQPIPENKFKELTVELTSINKIINNGRGSQTMRAIVSTDFDKLRQYDEENGSIQKLLELSGLKI